MPESPVPTQHLDVDGGRIAYDIRGAGPLVVMIPGMGELRSSYRFLAPALVDAGYRVVTADLRGHGESDTTFASYGDTETAADIRALIEHLGGPAVIVGNSLAAGAAVIVAADHPTLVDRLVLVGPFVRNPKINPVMKALFAALTAPWWIASSWKAYMPSLYAGRKPVDFEEYRGAVIANLRRREYGRAFSRTAQQTDHAPAEARIAAVKVPVLVVMGEKDPDFPAPDAEARWIGGALHARVVMVAEAGHYPHAQRPDVTTDAVLDFLRSGDRA